MADRVIHEEDDADDQPPGFRSTRSYRLTVAALALLGVAAAAAAATVTDPELRPVLAILAGIGFYGAAVLYFVRPGVTGADRPIDHVFDAYSSTLAALQSDLSLKRTVVYVPVEAAEEGFAPVRLFFPGRTTKRIPAPEDLDPVLDDDGSREGAVVYPTGAALFDRYDGMATTDLASTPDDLTQQLTEAAGGGLDIVGKTTVSVDRDEGRIVFDVREPRYGPVTRVDHPVTSFLATGLALGLGRPISTTSQQWGNIGYRIVCNYTPEEG